MATHTLPADHHYGVYVSGSYTITTFTKLDAANEFAAWAMGLGRRVTMAVRSRAESWSPHVAAWEYAAMEVA